jgi:hypothetical protein
MIWSSIEANNLIPSPVFGTSSENEISKGNKYQLAGGVTIHGRQMEMWLVKFIFGQIHEIK